MRDAGWMALVGGCWLLVGCPKEQPATAPDAASAAPSASASAPSASAAPSASESLHASAAASASAAPRSDCPAGSAGPGTFAHPCEAKGTARLMDVAWTGKLDDPGFRVASKSKLTILYGRLAVYFYDKAGTQLEVMEEGEGETPPKKKPYHACSGSNIFGGVVKPGEKATFTFSCMKKKHEPAGTVSIEAEMQTVGFADSTGKKNEYYWRNAELTPDARPKGGAK